MFLGGCAASPGFHYATLLQGVQQLGGVIYLNLHFMSDHRPILLKLSRYLKNSNNNKLRLQNTVTFYSKERYEKMLKMSFCLHANPARTSCSWRAGWGISPS